VTLSNRLFLSISILTFMMLGCRSVAWDNHASCLIAWGNSSGFPSVPPILEGFTLFLTFIILTLHPSHILEFPKQFRLQCTSFYFEGTVPVEKPSCQSRGWANQEGIRIIRKYYTVVQYITFAVMDKHASKLHSIFYSGS
jgi:hypothetical protein